MIFDFSIGDKVRVQAREGGMFVAVITDRLAWATQDSPTDDDAPCYCVQDVNEVQDVGFSGDGGPPPRRTGWFFADALTPIPAVDLLGDLARG